MLVPRQRQPEECCSEQRVCAICDRPICPEHDDDVVDCEINGHTCRRCHDETCTSLACARANDPTDYHDFRH